jgi:hypothetical protein
LTVYGFNCGVERAEPDADRAARYLDRGVAHHRRVHFPLIHSKGPKVNLTNERIYELVAFP